MPLFFCCEGYHGEVAHRDWFVFAFFAAFLEDCFMACCLDMTRYDKIWGFFIAHTHDGLSDEVECHGIYFA
jgi:hypothetical protein